MTSKTCSKCGEVKPLDSFGRDKRARDGRQWRCRACARAYDVANRERNRERSRTHREANSDKQRERARARYAANPEKMRKDPKATRAWRVANDDKVREYYSENRERIYAYNRAWKQANPDKRRAMGQRYRTKRKDPLAPVERFLDVDVFLRDGWVCQLCLAPVDPGVRWPDPWSPSLDHVVPVSSPDYVNHGHTMSNTQLAHLRCNLAKGDRSESA